MREKGSRVLGKVERVAMGGDKEDMNWNDMAVVKEDGLE